MSPRPNPDAELDTRSSTDHTRRTDSADVFVFPEAVAVRRLADPVIERIGFPVTHPYVERLWLPILGPASVCLLRNVGARLANTTSVEIVLAELAESIGLSRSSAGRYAPVQKTLRRLTQFGMATWRAELHVRTVLPPLSARHLARLSEPLQQQHRVLLDGHRTIDQSGVGGGA